MTTTTPDVHLEEDPRQRAPLVEGTNDFASVTDKVCRVCESTPGLGWWALFLPSVALMGLLFLMS